mmetsp:Transcript_12771/g.27659  ORF Transcript_12771/g.27659 Transcript_12771/m.27659 type:complete len:122 (+) Transcript_12771:951-1316(+)
MRPIPCNYSMGASSSMEYAMNYEARIFMTLPLASYHVALMTSTRCRYLSTKAHLLHSGGTSSSSAASQLLIAWPVGVGFICMAVWLIVLCCHTRHPAPPLGQHENCVCTASSKSFGLHHYK